MSDLIVAREKLAQLCEVAGVSRVRDKSITSD
jgi:hypothetical protein